MLPTASADGVSEVNRVAMATATEKWAIPSLSALIRKFDYVFFYIVSPPGLSRYAGLRLRRKGRRVKYYFFCR
jgi:hypothetical protein